MTTPGGWLTIAGDRDAVLTNRVVQRCRVFVERQEDDLVSKLDPTTSSAAMTASATVAAGTTALARASCALLSRTILQLRDGEPAANASVHADASRTGFIQRATTRARALYGLTGFGRDLHA
jgi:hypothetical protein